ncbi:C6 transcription factor, putative [Talaromyces stipitatus ATCC 10500]|uniref:C6 transcription factor, putative n=1 Tax=Talaromyces stipitatus (strain ATCC 10500 / CBS 375.48 / QM 6759 / NRRL 1006) TaxID=441959 RepID=B8MQL3_TALSN|nr:C6 transcription factor, putative [Talaromyces stipitatus ATCC 10500]EED13436.1 C6 transcription factor, putative [Talaromyces stipitatus ATCC 10500]
MGDEHQRPPRRPSIAVNQLVGNLDSFPLLSDSTTTSSSSASATGIIVGDSSRFRAPKDHHQHHHHHHQHHHPSLTRAAAAGGGPPAKVAIPRAPNLSEQSNVNRRVGHACESCREQKTKCSGDRPTCQRCQDLGLTCLYGDRKRERTAKQLRDLSKQVQEYEQLFNELQPKLDPEDSQLVQDLLSKVGPSDADFTGTTTSTVRHIVTSFLSGADYTEEDFNRNERSKALGFVGKHSETSWLYHLKRDLEFSTSSSSGTSSVDNPLNTPEDQDRNSIASVSYFLDDDEIPILDDAEPLARPPQTIANSLVQTFFTTVYPTFPLIVPETFIRQVNTFYASSFVRPGRRWLAILNLVFATSSRCLHHRMQSNSMVANDDTLVYFSRAWKLGMKANALLDHPDLQQVQIEGLLAIFLLASGHVNRAWRICGIAIRSATAMGLNLRSESNYVTLASKESRYKVWWSLYTLETILGNMTGRPLNLERDFCTTPLPVPFEEHEYTDQKVIRIMTDHKIRNSLLGHVITRPVGETPATVDAQSVRNAMEILKPNMTLYFVCYVDLTRIIRETVETLYAPEIVQNSARDAETAITDANAKLDTWLSKLPAGFRISEDEGGVAHDRYSLGLALHYYSAKMLACKPCLHYFNKPPSSTLSSSGDDTFYTRIAASCVQAACRMLDLFPAEFDGTWLNQLAPWWCMLHYTVQATAVLLIVFPLHPPGSIPNAARQALEKAASWLNEMARRDLASQRACTVCGALLAKLSGMAGRTAVVGEGYLSEVRLYR